VRSGAPDKLLAVPRYPNLRTHQSLTPVPGPPIEVLAASVDPRVRTWLTNFAPKYTVIRPKAVDTSFDGRLVG